MKTLQDSIPEQPNSKSLESGGGGDVVGLDFAVSCFCSKPSHAYRHFSHNVSTEDHFRVDVSKETPLFVGAFGHVRKVHLDYEFHAHYKKERQWLHDSIIDDYLGTDEVVASSGQDENTDDEQPPQWLILCAGVQGAGKHHTVRSLQKDHGMNLPSCCFIDSDEIRRLLPEYGFFLDHAPQQLDVLTQKECGYIAETLCWAALQAGQSVVWDSSLNHADWWTNLVRTVKETFPCLRVAVLHVTAPSAEVILQRRQKKQESTGRQLFPDDDLEYLQSESERVQQSVELLKPLTKFVVTIYNSENDGLQLVDEDKTWDDLTNMFHQEPKKRSDDTKCLRRIVSQEELPEDDDTPPLLKAPQNSPSTLQVSPSGSSLSIRRGGSRRRFSVFRSTEDNHSSNDRNFYGRFADIRATLDYSYHKNYTFERQRFQDAILQHFLQGAVITDKDGMVCTTPTEPWIVFTAGPMGAGKSYTMRQLVRRGRFPLVAFVNVDPDAIRRKLPEYHLYAATAPELAGELTRKEAGFLAEILTLAALDSGKNVLQDGSLRDAHWYGEYFGRLRKEFPILRLAIIQITAPKETILERAASRAAVTGRVVPESLLLEAFEQVPISVNQLAPMVDYHATLNNPPNVTDIQLVTEGETWLSFQSKWIQTCAWIPKSDSQKSLRKQKDMAIAAAAALEVQ